MKATMDGNGLITITPETGAEAFALRKWTDENYDPRYTEYRPNQEKTQGMFRGNNLIVVSSLPKEST